MRLPEGTAIGVNRRRREEGERLLAGDGRHRDLHQLCRARARRASSGSGSNPVACRTRNFRPRSSSLPRTSRARRAREGRGSKKAIADGALPESPYARRTASRSAPPVRLPRASFRVIGPDPDEGNARSAEEVRQVMATNSKIIDPHPRLERAGEVDPARGRPGPAPPAALGLTAAGTSRRRPCRLCSPA